MTTRRRPNRRYVETEEYLGMVHRVLAALGGRVGDADLAMFAGLAGLAGVVDELLVGTARRLHDDHGYSWTEIGRSLGITRQAARQRFSRQPEVVSGPAIEEESR